jgi:hypothetical protein
MVAVDVDDGDEICNLDVTECSLQPGGNRGSDNTYSHRYKAAPPHCRRKNTGSPSRTDQFPFRSCFCSLNAQDNLLGLSDQRIQDCIFSPGI